MIAAPLTNCPEVRTVLSPGSSDKAEDDRELRVSLTRAKIVENSSKFKDNAFEDTG